MSDPRYFEGCCPICGDFQLLRLPDDWNPQPVDLTCIMCRLVPASEGEQDLARAFNRKMAEARKC